MHTRKNRQSTKQLLLSTRKVAPAQSIDRTTRFLAKFLELKSREALAGEWDKFHGPTTVGEMLELYRRTYNALQLIAPGLPTVDLSGALPVDTLAQLATAA